MDGWGAGGIGGGLEGWVGSWNLAMCASAPGGLHHFEWAVHRATSKTFDFSVESSS